MADLWQEVIGEGRLNMETVPQPTAIKQAQKLIEEFNIENATLFDHKPVLRIQVPDSQFLRVLELRNSLVEKLKPTGFRFIAVDLDNNQQN